MFFSEKSPNPVHRQKHRSTVLWEDTASGCFSGHSQVTLYFNSFAHVMKTDAAVHGSGFRSTDKTFMYTGI